jgi:hypothetical protein
LIVGHQCTTTMRQKLEAEPDYRDIKNKSNMVALLKQLKQIVQHRARAAPHMGGTGVEMARVEMASEGPAEAVEESTGISGVNGNGAK